MHILLPLLGVLAGFGYWYFVLKNAGTAAVVMAVAVAGAEGPLSASQDAALLEAMTSVLAIDEPQEELTFAKWAADHVVDPNNVSMRLMRLWTGALSMNERRDLVDLVHKVAAADGQLSAVQEEAIGRLETRLAIAV